MSEEDEKMKRLNKVELFLNYGDELKHIEIDLNETYKEIERQAKVIQWYEKENRHNQEIIIKDIKEIERLNNIINEVREYAYRYNDKIQKDILEILNRSKGNV